MLKNSEAQVPTIEAVSCTEALDIFPSFQMQKGFCKNHKTPYIYMLKPPKKNTTNNMSPPPKKSPAL